MIQIFQPALASNPWLSILIGSVIPALFGVIVFAFLLPIVHALFPASASTTPIDPLFGIIRTYTP